MKLNRYPIFIPSKGRWEICHTAKFLRKDGVPFKLVVEPQEHDLYAAKFGEECIITLPENDPGLVFVRNWIFEYSIAAGHERHWQIDDNIHNMKRRYKGVRIPVESSVALRAVEDFTDRYSNVALSGMQYTMFVPDSIDFTPFNVNCHVYSNTLINNAIPYRFRPPANEDVDMCLQVLSGGWCTILLYAFLVTKIVTMQVKGGQTDAAYRGDGRLFMARSLERVWPGVVTTGRRYNRPQHYVKSAWTRFDTPLKYKPEFDPANVKPNDYGLRLESVADVKSPHLQRMIDENNQRPRGMG